jgi:cell division protein FtsB
MGIVIVKSWIWRGSKMNEDQYLYLLVKIKALEEENQELKSRVRDLETDVYHLEEKIQGARN